MDDGRVPFDLSRDLFTNGILASEVLEADSEEGAQWTAPRERLYPHLGMHFYTQRHVQIDGTWVPPRA